LDRSMGPLMGTIGGIGTWLALILKSAFALIGMGAYIGLFLPNVPVVPLAIFFAVAFGLLNLRGSKESGAAQVLLLFGLFAILVWFFSLGLFRIEPAHYAGFFDRGFDAILRTTGLVYVSYVGVTKVISVSEEIKNPERNLPLGVILSVVTAVLVYILGTSVLVGVLAPEKLYGSLTPWAAAAEAVSGRVGKILLSIAALFAFSSVANAGVLSSSRYPLAMSRDHLLPPRWRRCNSRGVPANSILLSVGTIIVLLLFFDAAKIAKLASSFQLILFALQCAAVIVMRESGLASYDPGFRSPLYPWMQIVGMLAPFFLIVQMGWTPMLFSVGLFGVGTAWYFSYARSRVIRDGAIYHIFERLGRQRYEGLDLELRTILKEK
ncbi:MAG: amino acid permease, partial [Deltaproteobacteria bacterium]